MIRRPGRLARWAAILLPFVVGARALLFVFQLGHDHQDRDAKIPPAWPPTPGEALHFRADNPAIRRWALPEHKPLTVTLIKRGFMLAPPETGCMLSPVAMARHVGTLSLDSQDAFTDWTATWSGGATMLTPKEAGIEEPDPKFRLIEAQMIAAADCGGEARLSLTQHQVHVLISLIANQPLPPPDAAPRQRTLHIRVDALPP